ncbi:hydrophobic surface binding protein A domain-containing protein [Pochonia chlamydosporia 170]|uniref:Hydrophobic surface binding protein A domain-containing protein n=1 Tax=Pochonia chlamydosporia 170 TaxID=1380566 RepID=A0A179EZ84_METCM|nr:hydrophobic surface binding protein A domain-containing protein [Pochonia chlamydosporia 170]OAQ58496.1 hydrophobic surface binding protein A domain-containing protein [Pochonia chlamydosporia 170]
MKLSLVVTCLAVEALGHQPNVLIRRDLTTITGVLDNVKSDLQKLGDTVKSATDDPAPLLKASNALINTIKAGKTKVDSTSELSFNDAIALIRPVQDLTNLGQSLTSNLKKIRPKLQRLGECVVVRIQVNSITSGSEALIKSVDAKIPESAREIASQLSAKLTKVLQQSQSDFSEQNCNSTAGGAQPTESEPSSSLGNSISAFINPSTSSAAMLIFLGAVATIMVNIA